MNENKIIKRNREGKELLEQFDEYNKDDVFKTQVLGDWGTIDNPWVDGATNVNLDHNGDKLRYALMNKEDFVATHHVIDRNIDVKALKEYHNTKK